MQARIVSLNLGNCRRFDLPGGGEIESAIRKQPQTGRVMLGVLGLAGDETSPDPAHGGPNRAMHVFALESHRVLEGFAGRALPIPTFGENLTLEGYDEKAARVGDVLRIGGALVQVSMPTERCSKPGRHAGEPRLLEWMLETLRTGFYVRVLEPGEIGVGDACELVEAGSERFSIEVLNEGMIRNVEDEDCIASQLALDALAPEWKARLLVLHERRTGRSHPRA